MSKGFRHYKERIDKVCRKYADRGALSELHDDGHISVIRYKEIHQIILNFKAIVDRLGLKPGDRVVLLDSHVPSALRTVLSLLYWNITVSPIDPGLPDKEINEFIELLEARAVFTVSDVVPRLTDAIKAKLPVLDVRAEDLSYPEISGFDGEKNVPPTSDPDPDVMAIIFSSGTTGTMKPVEITFGGFMFCWKTDQRLLGLTHRTTVLMVFPMSHVSGLQASVIIFLCGGCINMVETFNSSVLQPALQAYQPHFFGMVPKVFDIMIQKMEETIHGMGPVVEGYYHFARKVSSYFQKQFGIRAVGRLMMKPFSSKLFGKNIELVFTGSAPSLESTASAIMDLGIVWANMYASTESSVPMTSTDRFDRYAPGTSGNVNHNPGIEVKINKPDDEGIGEIYVKTKGRMKGYFREPQLTADAFDNGYIRTGDLGYIDERGYLYITGRRKEAILLHTGKKVSPADLENILAAGCEPDNQVALCGIPVEDQGYDEIHAFFETKGMSEEKKEAMKQKFLEFARKKAPLYPIKEVHFIDQIPKTAVFKVKRYILKDYVQNKMKGIEMPEMQESAAKAKAALVNAAHHGEDLFAQLVHIIKEKSQTQSEIKESSRLTDDLGIDSLTVYEICAEIEKRHGVFIGNAISGLTTVGDMAKMIHRHHAENGTGTENAQTGKQAGKQYNINDYPAKRNLFHKMVYGFMKFLAMHLFTIEAEGLGNVPKDKPYIIAPNHQTNLDGLFVMAPMGMYAPKLEDMACMAKEEILENPFTRPILNMMGGIPVDRTGNSTTAMRRSLEWLQEGHSFLIHPEGTRTRDGKLGVFKNGAAQLSLESGTPVVPVTIIGAYELYPAGSKLPKFGGKIKIIFGEVIEPKDQTADEMTEQIRSVIAANLGE